MKLPVAIAVALMTAIALMTSAAHAVTVPIGGAVLTDGADFIAGKTRIKFPGTATFDLDVTAGQQYTITIYGHTDAAASFSIFSLILTDSVVSAGTNLEATSTSEADFLQYHSHHLPLSEQTSL
jgi:hypothetical protein